MSHPLTSRPTTTNHPTCDLQHRTLSGPLHLRERERIAASEVRQSPRARLRPGLYHLSFVGLKRRTNLAGLQLIHQEGHAVGVLFA